MPRFIRHIATRFALLLALAAVVPLIAYGIISIMSLQRGTRQEVMQGNQNVATRAAEEIRRYVLFGAQAMGVTDKLKGFAEQCMAEYDIDGWKVPDLKDPDELSYHILRPRN